MNENERRLQAHGIKVRPIEKNDVDILNLIDKVDLNIAYWKLHGRIYEKRIAKLVKLKADLFDLIG